MDARLLRYYNEELRYLREQGAEFARAFPKIAARLGMDGVEVEDPYVERLLEGCAFLAARVQLKQDAEFPRLSQRLLELTYPNFLAPIPSMLVAQVEPQPDANLLKGPVLARGTAVHAPAAGDTDTRCEFRTTQDLQLTPLRTESAEYFLNVGELKLASLPLDQRPRSGMRVRLQLPEGMSVAQLEVDALTFYIGGPAETGMRVYEALRASTVGMLLGAPGRTDGRQFVAADQLQAVGYADDEAMLPQPLNGLGGLRLLQEYFAFAERFLFLRVCGLREALRQLGGNALELTFLLSRPVPGADGMVDASNFALHCVPAINLFPKRADRIQVDARTHEFHVVPDRSHPLDYEVFAVESLSGVEESGAERRFLPLFATDHASRGVRQPGYFSVWREPRLMSEKARRDGPRSGYIGSEMFVSLVDPDEAPYSAALRQLSVQTLCTNRDLPLFVAAAGAQGQFQLDTTLAIGGLRVIAGPSRPQTALRDGAVAWRLLNLLSLNYLSLLDADDGEAVAALRDLLMQFPGGAESSLRRQVESLQNVQVRAVVRRHPLPGPIAFARGFEISLHVDELGHEGGSALLFCAALHHYLARHVGLNSFVETVMVSLTRGEVMRWAPRLGARPLL